MREEKVWAPPLHFHGIQIQFKLCKFYSLENHNLPRSFYSDFLRCILIFKNHFSRWSLITPRLLTSCWSPTQRWYLTMTLTMTISIFAEARAPDEPDRRPEVESWQVRPQALLRHGRYQCVRKGMNWGTRVMVCRKRLTMAAINVSMN